MNGLFVAFLNFLRIADALTATVWYVMHCFLGHPLLVALIYLLLVHSTIILVSISLWVDDMEP